MSLYWQSVLTPICIDAIAVLGLYVIALSGRLSAGHAVFVGVGGYTSGVLMLHLTSNLTLGLVLGFGAAALLGAVFAEIIEPLDGWFFAVATLAIGLVATAGAEMAEPLGGALGIYGAVNEITLPLAAVTLAATTAVIGGLGRTPWGRRLRAVRDDPLAAASLGINVRTAHVTAFAVGAGVAGLAGAMRFNYIGFVQPTDMSFERSLLYLVYLTVGGATVLAGPVLGTFALGLLPELLRPVGNYRLEVYGALVVVVMIFRPAGLVPDLATIRRFLRRRRSRSTPGTAAPDVNDPDEMADAEVGTGAPGKQRA